MNTDFNDFNANGYESDAAEAGGYNTPNAKAGPFIGGNNKFEMS